MRPHPRHEPRAVQGQHVRLIPILLGLLLTLALTLAAFGLPVLDSLGHLWEGALGDKFAIHRTLVKASPLILAGLGMVVAWRGGMFNIGGEGQLLMGASAGAITYHLLSRIQGPALTVLVLAACCLAGALWACIAALLYTKRGVNVVISTILLNFVAIHMVSYLVRGPLQAVGETIPQTTPLPASAMFQRLDPQSSLHTGLFIAPLLALTVHVWLKLTASGFQLRLVGQNPSAAQAARIPVAQTQVLALTVRGALCGLAGGVEYVGVSGYLFDGFSPGWGYLSIAVALLGGLEAWGVVLSGLYFGALVAGSRNLEAFGGASSAFVYAVQGIAVIAFVALQQWARRKVERTAS
ncbi:MAG: ABC transporter permease [Armatimonadota bacterium]